MCLTPKKTAKSKYLILQAGSALSHVWDQCKPESCYNVRCSSYVTHSVGQPCTREFLQDEGLEREQEVPLGVSFHTCDVVGTCMGDSGGSWSRVMPQGVMSTS